MYRQHFNIKEKEIYLDSAATTLRPVVVAQEVFNFSINDYSSVNRGVSKKHLKTNEILEKIREKVRLFINAQSKEEIIFTKSTTEGINLIAQGLKKQITKNDIILLTKYEHNSNYLPWVEIAKEKEAIIQEIKLTDNDMLDLEDFQIKLNNKPKIIAISLASNVSGNVVYFDKILKILNNYDGILVVDAAQAVGHFPLDLKKMEKVDFMVFSGHKMYAPPGVGVLYGQLKHLNSLSPLLFGGGMVSDWDNNNLILDLLPHRLEGGTLPLDSIVGLGAAIDFINNIGFDNIFNYEQELVEYTLNKFNERSFLKLLGTKNSKSKVPVFSFYVKNIDSLDLCLLLDLDGIVLRTGKMCAHNYFKEKAQDAVRISLSICNEKKDIDLFFNALDKRIKQLEGYNERI